jgi:predicted SAM-dependent methyltransferase
MNRLEIGPGTANGKSVIWADADTVDTAAAGATCNSRWGQEPFPFADSTYGLVFASHVLEHVPWYRTDAAIAEVHRVLKVGGEF